MTAQTASHCKKTHPVARNLIATPEIKHQLLEAWRDPKVKGPLPGSTYLGQYGDIRYAVATFDLPVSGTTDQPELLVKVPGLPWLNVNEIGGGPPSQATQIPCALRKIWGFGCG